MRYNVVDVYGIPVNRRYFDSLEEAFDFLHRQEEEDKEFGYFEPDSYTVECVEKTDSAVVHIA